ncbi:MAG TPA: amidohydrolase family protein, partial [Acidimicrobiia bacterium]|nr:amidohydrolase family protein [Acidimicrobiia bacterium]
MGATTAFELRVVGGTVVSGHGREAVNLYATGGRVALVDGAIHPARSTVEATDLLVMPGMVDTHVHLMDPGDTSREDFPTGSRAAAAAGVTTIIEHTHGHPIRSVTDLAEKLAHLRDRSAVDVGLAAHVWPDRLGELRGLWEAGVAFFKIFT